jgi:hypothetical protein
MVSSEVVQDRSAPAPSAVRAGVVVVLGLVMDAVTSVLQKYLNFPWLSLVNAAILPDTSSPDKILGVATQDSGTGPRNKSTTST